MLKSVVTYTVPVLNKTGIRLFSTSPQICQDFPSLDPSMLNPLSTKNTSSQNNELSKSLNHLYSNKQGKPNVRQHIEYSHRPRDDALNSRVTGVVAGRTVNVFNGDTANAFRQLNSIMFANNIAQDKRSQRFHMKPGKVAEMKRSQKHRRDFMKGFKRLIEIVKDAKRKGY